MKKKDLKIKLTEWSDFKDDLDKYVDLVNKGEHVFITKKNKPFLSLSSANMEDLEDYLLAKHYGLDKKSRKSKYYTHEQVKKHLGL